MILVVGYILLSFLQFVILSGTLPLALPNPALILFVGGKNLQALKVLIQQNIIRELNMLPPQSYKIVQTKCIGLGALL